MQNTRHFVTAEVTVSAVCRSKDLQHCGRRLFVLLPQMSSFLRRQRRHAPYRRERPLLAKEGTITKEFSLQIRNLRKY